MKRIELSSNTYNTRKAQRTTQGKLGHVSYWGTW